MDPGSVLAFLAVDILLVLTPGADWALAITAGLRDRSVVPAVSGILMGYVALTGAVVAGLAAAIAGTPTALTALTVVGAVYLIWLGITTLRSPAAVPGPGEPTRNPLLRGLGTSALNPKAYLLYLALLPQFVDPYDAWAVPVQVAILGLLHVLACGAVYFAVAILARLVLRARPVVAVLVTRLSGIAMTTIGIYLLVDRLA
jgi:threonine/homoserine/homoserine lactone efflux protein